jgi:hypothetical protein
MAAPAGSSGSVAADAPKGIFLAEMPAVDTSVAKLMIEQWVQIVGGLRNVQSDSVEHAVIFPRTSISNLLQSIPNQGALVHPFWKLRRHSRCQELSAGKWQNGIPQ